MLHTCTRIILVVLIAVCFALVSVDAFAPMSTNTAAVAATTTAPLLSSSSRRRSTMHIPPSATSSTTMSAWNPCRMLNCRSCPLPPNLLYCSAVTSSSDDSSFSDSASEASIDIDSSESKTAALFGLQQPQKLSLMEGLLKISNWASLLCVLDCTILPLVTIILPLFGIVAASPAQMAWLHEAGHKVALFFVLPVGGLATTMNFLQHRKKRIATLGVLGLIAVVAANAGCHNHFVHSLPGALGHYTHKVLHTLHHGLIHRVTNLVGCAMLLTSNYWSHKQGSCANTNCCDHTHNH